MPSLGLSAIATALQTALQNASQLVGVHVSQELDEPTADQCPAILIEVGSVRWEERYITARDPTTASSLVNPSFNLHCIEFSAQSAEDARTLRDTLLDNLIYVLRRNRQVGGVLDVRIQGIEPVATPPSNGMFSIAVLRIETEKLV